MAKVLILGDLHIGFKNASPIYLNMMNEVLQNEIYPYILKNKIKTVICLGDILDKRKSCEFTASNFLKNNFFDFFRKNKITLYSILGNHDMYYRQSTQLDGPSQFLEANEKYINIIKTPELLEIDNKKFALVPWICDENKEEVVSWIQEHEDKESFILGHFELAGFIMQMKMKSEKGTIDSNILKGYRTVFSGHYHTPSEKDNVMYVGTPYELTWADYGDEKKFVCYDTTTDEIEIIPTKTKMFYKIFFTDNIMDTFNYEEFKRKYIKIVISNDYDDKILSLFQAELEEKCTPIDLQVVDNRIIHRKDDGTNDIEIESFNLENPLEIMQTMINNRFESDINQISNCKDWINTIYKMTQENTKVQV